MLRQKGQIHEEETIFLKEKNAVKIHPELNTVELLVKYPQPNMIYVLRWIVPKCVHSIPLPQSYAQKLDVLREEILNPNSLATANFYNEVVQFLSKEILDDDDKISIFLFGYDKLRTLLNITWHPDEWLPKHKLRVGRGPAGKAFKIREVVWWDKADEIRAAIGKPAQTIEKVISGFDPVAVICFPLLYPKISWQDWGYINKNLEEPKKKISPVFGVLSVATMQNSVSFSRLINNIKICKEKGKKIRELEIIYGKFEDAYNKYLHPILQA